MKGDEGVRSPRGGTTEAMKPQPTDVPKWVGFPSEPDQHFLRRNQLQEQAGWSEQGILLGSPNQWRKWKRGQLYET